MENVLIHALESGNITAVLGCLLVYLIIHIQRKNTASDRDKSLDELKKEIADLQKENELKQKDIDFLLQENSGIKDDIKEIKGTLNQMAISLAEIATQSKIKNKV